MISALLVIQVQVVPKDDLKISSSCKVRPGAYRLDDKKEDGLLAVTKDGVTIDFTGATFSGSGTLLDLKGRKNVRIVGLSAVGYMGGIKVTKCSQVVVENAEGVALYVESSNKCDVLFGKLSRLRVKESDDFFALGAEVTEAPTLADSERSYVGYLRSPGLRFDTVTIAAIFRYESKPAPIGAELLNSSSVHVQYCDFIQGDVGVRIQGGEDNWLLNSNVKNQRVGIDLVKTRDAVIGANTIRDCSSYAIDASGAGDVYFEANSVRNAPIPPGFAPLDEHSEEYHHREWLRTVVERGKEIWLARK